MKETRNIEIVEDYPGYRVWKMKNGFTRSGRQKYRLRTQLKIRQ
jgi:hypothetical protein